MKGERLSRRSTDIGARVGTGQVILPPNISREDYIRNSTSSGTVSIALEDGGFFADIPVSKPCLNYIEFPQTRSELGSQVIWAKLDKVGYPIIIGIITKANELITVGEHQFELKRELDSLVQVKGDASKGIISITVDGGDTVLGELNISVKNNNKKGKINIFVDNSLNINVGESVNLKTNKEFSIEVLDNAKQQTKTKIDYVLGRGLIIEDEFGNKIELNENFFKAQVQKFIVEKEFQVAGGKEPILLGDSLIKELTKEDNVVTAIINALINSPVSTQQGAPPDGGAVYKAAIAAALSQFLTPATRAMYEPTKSKVSSTD